MSTPYSGASAAGPPQGYAEPTPQNYAADYSGGMGTPTTEAGRPDVEGTSVGQLMGEVAKDLSSLMRQELELAKAEVKAEAKKAGTGTTTGGTPLPPPPYGTVPPEGSMVPPASPAGWDDPARRPGGVG